MKNKIKIKLKQVNKKSGPRFIIERANEKNINQHIIQFICDYG